MPQTLVFLIIGLFFGTGLGFLFAATGSKQMSPHSMGATDSAVHDHSAHDHEGMDKAFKLCGQHQKHHQQAEDKHEDDGPA